MGILHESKFKNKMFLLLGYEPACKISEAYLELLQPSKRELLAKIVNGFKLLIVFTKSSTLDVCSGSTYTIEYKIV